MLLLLLLRIILLCDSHSIRPAIFLQYVNPDLNASIGYRKR
jgi:hypothetical protein